MDRYAIVIGSSDRVTNLIQKERYSKVDGIPNDFQVNGERSRLRSIKIPRVQILEEIFDKVP